MASEKNNNNQQVYNVYDDNLLIGRVDTVLCVLMRRGFWAAGYSAEKELLTIHYSGYNRTRRVWELDFFEQVIANEPLLMAKDKIPGVFIASERSMVIPSALYDDAAAKEWMKTIHFIESKDEILNHSVTHDATYVMAVPMNVTELIRINFKKAAILPLPVYQFSGLQRIAPEVKCCISAEQACISLFDNGQLQWHTVMDHAGAEDIAYSIKHYCDQNDIDTTSLQTSFVAISGTEYDVVNGLSQYFPGLVKGNAKNNAVRWQPVVSLAQELITCV